MLHRTTPQKRHGMPPTTAQLAQAGDAN
jgi:hypothetical protein